MGTVGDRCRCRAPPARGPKQLADRSLPGHSCLSLVHLPAPRRPRPQHTLPGAQLLSTRLRRPPSRWQVARGPGGHKGSPSPTRSESTTRPEPRAHSRKQGAGARAAETLECASSPKSSLPKGLPPRRPEGSPQSPGRLGVQGGRSARTRTRRHPSSPARAGVRLALQD